MRSSRSTISATRLSWLDNTVIEDYVMAIEDGILSDILGRAVFVTNETGTVVYQGDSDGIRELPDLADRRGTGRRQSLSARCPLVTLTWAPLETGVGRTWVVAGC